MISSTYGLWTSSSSSTEMSFKASFFNSSTEPITFNSPQSGHSQIGIGIPQYLCLEMVQSLALSTQSLNLPWPAHCGTHSTLSISSSIFCLMSVTFKNHCLVAKYIIGVLHLQHTPYLCSIVSFLYIKPLSCKSAIIPSLAALQNSPAYFPASSVKLPLSSTGQKIGKS